GRVQYHQPARLQGIEHSIKVFLVGFKEITLSQPNSLDGLSICDGLHGLAKSVQWPDQAVGEANGVQGNEGGKENEHNDGREPTSFGEWLLRQDLQDSKELAPEGHDDPHCGLVDDAVDGNADKQ